MASRTRIFGRDQELRTLEEEWERACAEGARGVLITGALGIGKTRVAAEFAATRGGAVALLRARAHPLSATASFGLWTEAVDSCLAGMPLEQIRSLAGSCLDDLAALSHAVAEARGSVAMHEPPRYRLLEGLAGLMGRLADHRAVLVLLDDLHLADASSWDALHYLLTRLRTSQVLFVCTARAGEIARHPVAAQVVLDLERDDLLQYLRLGNLDEGAVRQLAESIVGGQVDGAVLDWLFDRAQGNPLLTTWLLQSIEANEGDILYRDHPAIPARLKIELRGRFEALDPAPLRVLHALAVAGGRVEIDLLGQMLAESPDVLEPTLERLEHLAFVQRQERSGRLVYEVSNPLLQEAIYEMIGVSERRTLHRQVARVLFRTGRLGDSVLHFARSADEGDREVVEALCHALQQAESRQAYRESLKILGALGECLPELDPHWTRVADALSLQPEWMVDHRADADMTAALVALRRIDGTLSEDSDVHRRAEVKSRLATGLAWGAADQESAAVFAEEAVELYTRARDQEKTLIAMLELAYIRGMSEDVPTFESNLRRIVALADSAKNRSTSQRARVLLGSALLYQGRLGLAEVQLRESLELAQQENDGYGGTRSYRSLAWNIGLQGHLDEAVEFFGLAREANADWRECNLLETEAHVRWLAGDLRGALACVKDAVLLDPGGPSLRRGLVTCVAALSYAEAGRLGEAKRYADAAKKRYGRRKWYFLTDLSRFAEGVVARVDGNDRGALSLLRTSAEEFLASGASVFAAPALLEAAEVAAELRDLAACSWAAEELAHVSASVDCGPYIAMSLLAAGAAYLLRCDSRSAGVAADGAIRSLGADSCSILAARALELRGRSLAGHDPGAAAEHLKESESAFEACGAIWRRERARALRARIEQESTTGPLIGTLETLTPRETEVARLAAQRLSAQEIAQVLFIGRRTVETHITRVYAKLGVRSRRELSEHVATWPQLPPDPVSDVS